ncbi:deoxynucleoside kinase [Variovorax paradoxus]|uniref:deoxynucleoside kinase n=1 Tax=Variovorax paradoxus TaxID=34073 RepID=UPI00155E485F
MEDVAGNPYLKGVYARSPSFDARASQRWFLAQIADFVERSNDSSTLLMDQDPAAEVRVYAHLMREDELLSRDAYVELLTTLAALESRLGSRQQRVTIYLDADEVTLRARMIARGDREVPTEAWLRRVRMSFAELSDRNRNSRLVRTEGRDVDSVVDDIADLTGLR